MTVVALLTVTHSSNLARHDCGGDLLFKIKTNILLIDFCDIWPHQEGRLRIAAHDLFQSYKVSCQISSCHCPTKHMMEGIWFWKGGVKGQIRLKAEYSFKALTPPSNIWQLRTAWYYTLGNWEVTKNGYRVYILLERRYTTQHNVGQSRYCQLSYAISTITLHKCYCTISKFKSCKLVSSRLGIIHQQHGICGVPGSLVSDQNIEIKDQLPANSCRKLVDQIPVSSWNQICKTISKNIIINKKFSPNQLCFNM